MADEKEGVIAHNVNFYAVPEDCVSALVAFTTPRDSCRLALVSKLFCSASESDVVWERFLPSDCEVIVSRSDGGEELLAEIQSKKNLYMHLANRPLLVDGAAKCFWLEKSSGKKCWMLSARSLTIVWGDTPRYWKWTAIPESSCSKFPEVAELILVWWLEIRGTIKTSTLSPGTLYAAYLVFKMTEGAYGFDNLCAETSVSSTGGETETHNVYLGDDYNYEYDYELLCRVRVSRRPRVEGAQYPKPRTDGWQELKIGEFFTHLGVEDEIDLSLMEVKAGTTKGGLVVEGIELRPVRAK